MSQDVSVCRMSQGYVPFAQKPVTKDLAPLQDTYSNDCFLADGTLEMHEELCTLQDPCRLFFGRLLV